jgi:hypothetical protein
MAFFLAKKPAKKNSLLDKLKIAILIPFGYFL